MKRIISIIIFNLIFSSLVYADRSTDKEIALDLKCSLQSLGLTRFYVDKKVFDGEFGLYKAVESRAVVKDVESSIKDSSRKNLHDFNVMAFDQCISLNAEGHEISKEFFEQSKQSHECLKSLTIQSVYLVSAANGIKQKDAEKLYIEKTDKIGLPNNPSYASDVYLSSSISEISHKIKSEFFSCKKNIQHIYNDIPLNNLINIGNK